MANRYGRCAARAPALGLATIRGQGGKPATACPLVVVVVVVVEVVVVLVALVVLVVVVGHGRT